MDGTILIVDDCRTNRALMRELLAELPWALIEAGDGLEALAAARKHRPRLVIMDVEMPGLDGLHATELLRRDPLLADVRVLVLTGDNSEEGRAKALRAGCDAYLGKPLRRAALLAQVRALLEATA